MQSSAVDNQVRASLLSAVTWFDVFDFPLTAVEAAHYSSLFGQTVSVAEAVKILSDEPLIAQRDGYYYIEGMAENVRRRKHRFRLAGSKLKRAHLVARLFGLLPSVRQVAVCNSLAIANASEDSDIDLYVACRPGTVWLTRLMLAVPLIILRLRPTPGNQKDKICLSFLAAENAVDFDRLHLEGDDPYMRFWSATLLPLYTACPKTTQVQTVSKPPSAACLYLGSKRTGSRLNKLAKRIQIRRFPESIRRMANLDSRVLISDDILKFHVNDRREHYREQFRSRLSIFGL
jgi:hypothetical protein